AGDVLYQGGAAHGSTAEFFNDYCHKQTLISHWKRFVKTFSGPAADSPQPYVKSHPKLQTVSTKMASVEKGA
ncbi:MAG: hypothetical protein PHH07_08505, partial [Candidatus Cloacimonetes bacterium]|nr:hypothetical protein [Candidatus Cloacimonadota bacterium]